jgi:TPR repeat protein
MSLAEQGSEAAQYNLGVLYDSGRGVPQDYAQAAKWYRKAADQGAAYAQTVLGFTYDVGHGVPQNYAEAAKWYRKAADQGVAFAQYNLGVMSKKGRGVFRDDWQSANWYSKAAGKERRTISLDQAYGRLVTQISVEMESWYRQTAGSGDVEAQATLGFMYDKGHGVPQDDREAAKWYRKAAEQGVAFAQFMLGAMYQSGDGVPQDYAEAAKWYRRAADQGAPYAQLYLGIMYREGHGVPQDYAQAHLWFNLSASGFPPGEYREAAAKARNDVADKMVPAKVALAQEMARNWQARSEEPDPQPPQGYKLVEPTLQAPSGEATDEEIDAALRRTKIAAVQEALAELGYDPGPPDGILGSQTQTAIRTYQAAVGLPVDGEVSDALLNSLRATLALAETTTPQPANKAPELSATGTGFVVSLAGHILTNLHVVKDCKIVHARRSGVLLEGTTVSAIDSVNDLALLPRTGTSGRATFRQGREIRAGDSVVAVGFPLQGLLASSANVTTGTVSAVAGIQDDARYLQITAPIQPGNSGGPLFDMSGNVVGVVVSKLDALLVAEAIGDIPQNVNFAIKDTVARSFLDAQGVEYATASSDRELSAAEIGERATGFTVLVECWK